MKTQEKRPRGRPRKYPKDHIDAIVRQHGCTKRGANNKLLQSFCLYKIANECPEDTQRFFFGGRTYAESIAGKPNLFCSRSYVMAELGRLPDDRIAPMADAIANNPSLSTRTQKEIVSLLKSKRLREL